MGFFKLFGNLVQEVLSLLARAYRVVDWISGVKLLDDILSLLNMAYKIVPKPINLSVGFVKEFIALVNRLVFRVILLLDLPNDRVYERVESLLDIPSLQLGIFDLIFDMAAVVLNSLVLAEQFKDVALPSIPLV